MMGFYSGINMPTMGGQPSPAVVANVGRHWNLSPTSPPLQPQTQSPFKPTQMPYEQASALASSAMGAPPPPGQTPVQALQDYMSLMGVPLDVSPQRNDAITPPAQNAAAAPNTPHAGASGLPMVPGALAGGNSAYGSTIPSANPPPAGYGGFGGYGPPMGYGGFGFGAPMGYGGYSPANYLVGGTSAATIPTFNPLSSTGNLYPSHPVWVGAQQG